MEDAIIFLDEEGAPCRLDLRGEMYRLDQAEDLTEVEAEASATASDVRDSR